MCARVLWCVVCQNYKKKLLFQRNSINFFLLTLSKLRKNAVAQKAQYATKNFGKYRYNVQKKTELLKHKKIWTCCIWLGGFSEEDVAQKIHQLFQRLRTHACIRALFWGTRKVGVGEGCMNCWLCALLNKHSNRLIKQKFVVRRKLASMLSLCFFLLLVCVAHTTSTNNNNNNNNNLSQSQIEKQVLLKHVKYKTNRQNTSFFSTCTKKTRVFLA